MKYNWGTGIILFLAMFMIALISFVIFAWNQDVNLVHRDYYEKGVDYSGQIEKEKRSREAAGLIRFSDSEDSVLMTFPRKYASSAESGNILFFRPSDHNRDFSFPLTFHDSTCRVPKANLIPGRYIVKITWMMGNLPYEVDKEFIVR